MFEISFFLQLSFCHRCIRCRDLPTLRLLIHKVNHALLRGALAHRARYVVREWIRLLLSALLIKIDADRSDDEKGSVFSAQ